ncbi:MULTISPECIES: cupin domain-containing protein [Arenibacter]|uniref:cupin domain-containing protein n=1 Tax=Arenibacter TaxID=178469 RepID=UPI001C06DD4E|nr:MULTISPECIES: cupin domain-containing protein [Arenibacter]MBU2906573.1 cupin domain-containing protein [Arenibacter algicola]MCK0134859.1 cupin domain-containing protein [Arenibacter sp. S6351L]
MDRKKFLKASGIGLGMMMMPGMVQCQSSSAGDYSIKTEPKIIKDEEGNVLNVIGDIQTHKLVGSETGNQIVEWVDNVGPGVGIPPHIHTKEDEIFRVIKGQVEIMVDGETTVLNEGDVAFAPKNIPHSWKVVGTEMAKMITSAFPAGIEFMFQELAELPEGPPDFEKVAQICAKQGITFV